MSKAARPRPTSWKWWVCGLLLFATMINYMDRQTLANAAVRITNEFHLTQEQYGNLELAFGWAFAAGSLLFGFIADRVSVRWLYPAILVLWSLTGVITGLMQTYNGLIVCRTLLGFFEAGHWPCALKTTQRLLAPNDRAMGNSILQSGASIGAILTPLIMARLLTEQAGSWRPAFQIIGAGGLVWIIFWFALVRSEDMHTTARSEPELREKNPETQTLREILMSRRFLVLLIIVALINTCWQLLRAWLPKFLIEGRGFAESNALDFTALYYIATDVGCLGAGALTLWLARRGRSVHGARSLVFLCCAFLTALTTIIAFLPKGWALLGILLLIGAGALGVFPCYYAFSQELTVRHQGMVTGITGLASWLSAGTAQKYFGRLIDRTHSFDLGLALAGCLPMVAFVALWWLWNSPRQMLQRKAAEA
ncbi:MAG TPA: MFS transporter [Candidatus Eisenbacteria bacterium]|nr:MFS transporter [Candidatus Eisenbacteria bacterium]